MLPPILMSHGLINHGLPFWSIFELGDVKTIPNPRQEWHNPMDDAEWRKDIGEPPFKGFSVMLQIPGSHSVDHILLDYLHIYHLGYGQDASASSIVLLAHLGQFGPGKLDDKLEVAYTRFDAWCRANSTKYKTRTTSIDSFSSPSFGMMCLGL